MKVLFIVRDNWQQCKAGDTVQIQGTCRALQAMGVQVDVKRTSELEQTGTGLRQVNAWEWVHVFNLLPVEETLLQAEWAKRNGLRVALSTIFWDIQEYLEKAEPDGAVHLLNWNHANIGRKKLVELADLLLPNSRVEAEELARLFGPRITGKCGIVPNAVDPGMTEEGLLTGNSVKYLPGEPFVLCVARFARRKNQLALINAMRNSGWPLVFIGPVNDLGYYQECRRAAGPQTHFLGEMSQRQIIAAYQQARVHVLPSWYDTPGLVSLEAALNGCRIVTTDRGSAREYFGAMAWYCSPDSEESIRAALLAAWHSFGHPGLYRHILAHFTWESAARATLGAYRGDRLMEFS